MTTSFIVIYFFALGTLFGGGAFAARSGEARRRRALAALLEE